VVEVKTYTVTTERSGNWWAFSVPEISGAHGQARRLEQVRDEARDVISMMLDAEPDSFDVSLSVRLDPRIERALDEAKAARQEFDSPRKSCGSPPSRSKKSVDLASATSAACSTCHSSASLRSSATNGRFLNREQSV
jgi:predicted RNase H-like HicB family nuclease